MGKEGAAEGLRIVDWRKDSGGPGPKSIGISPSSLVGQFSNLNIPLMCLDGGPKIDGANCLIVDSFKRPLVEIEPSVKKLALNSSRRLNHPSINNFVGLNSGSGSEGI